MLQRIPAEENGFTNPAYNLSYDEYKEWLQITDNNSRGIDLSEDWIPYGYSEYDARFGAARTAYRFLEDNELFPTIKDEIDNPNYNDSIGQLETLSRRGYFSLPTYKYKENHDEDGNPIWACQCKIKEVDIVTNGRSSSKKDAKKQAAYDMLTFVLEEE